jgi:hypothetical protein
VESGWLGSRTIPPIEWSQTVGGEYPQVFRLHSQSTCRNLCRDQLADCKSTSVLDIPIAVGHMSAMVIGSAQAQRSEIFGTQ